MVQHAPSPLHAGLSSWPAAWPRGVLPRFRAEGRAAMPTRAMGPEDAPSGGTEVSPWLSSSRRQVLIRVAQSEMGQGILDPLCR